MTSRSPAVASKPLFESVSTAEISVSADRIDVSDWLFDLTSGEYQFCSPDHIACGSSLAPDGRRMSINVESMGGDVLIQHYIEEVADPHHCRVRSESDLLQALWSIHDRNHLGLVDPVAGCRTKYSRKSHQRPCDAETPGSLGGT